MDTNRFFLFIVVSSVLFFGGTVLRHRPLRGWIVVSVVVLAVTAAAWLWNPELAGWVAVGPWGVFFFAPLLLNGAVTRAAGKREFRRARIYGVLLSALHPADGIPERLELIYAGADIERGDFDSARDRLGRLAPRPDLLGHEAQVELLRLDGRWQELREWVEQAPGKLLSHKPVLGAYLRALGELGDVEEMLRVFRPLAITAQVRRDPGWLTTATLVVAALAGLPEEVRRLQAGVLRFLPEDVRRHWLATALQAAGRRDEARELFQALQEKGRPSARLAIARRLEQPLPRAPEIEPEVYGILHRAVSVEAERPPPEGSIPYRPWATWLVVVVNAIAYLVEVPGGTEDAENLYDLGALVVPPQPGDGWWRLVTAGFLHAGPLHLALNLVGIWYFGRRLERRVGHVPFLFTFLVAGPLAMALVVVIAMVQAREPYLLVGASAAAMAIVGATLALLLLRWRRERSAAVRRELPPLLAILFIQSAFDLLTPQVSFTGHASGVAVGLVIGALLGLRGVGLEKGRS